MNVKQKKGWRYLLLGLLMVIILPGCNRLNKIPESSIVITDLDQYYGFDKNEAGIEYNSSQKVNGKLLNTGLINRYTKETNQFLVSKSTTTKDLSQYLISVDKDSGVIKETEPYDGDFYSICVDGELIYTVSSRMNSIILCSYNTDLELINTENISFEADVVIPTAICKFQNTIYVLCGFVTNDAAYGTVSNKLLSFSPDFKYLDCIDLNLNDGAWQDMIQIDGKIYLARTTQGLSETGDAVPSYQIDIFSLETSEFCEPFINLEIPYPHDLKLAQSSDSLAILPDYSRYSEPSFTILDLSDHSIQTYRLSAEALNWSAFSTVPFLEDDESNWYFLTQDSLAIINKSNGNVEYFDLKPYGIDQAYGLLVR